MKINSNSWHFKMVEKMGTHYYDIRRMDSCQYIRRVVWDIWWALVLAAIVLALMSMLFILPIVYMIVCLTVGFLMRLILL